MAIVDLILKVLGWIFGGAASLFKNDKPTKETVTNAKDDGAPDGSVFARPDRLQPPGEPGPKGGK